MAFWSAKGVFFVVPFLAFCIIWEFERDGYCYYFCLLINHRPSIQAFTVTGSYGTHCRTDSPLTSDKQPINLIGLSNLINPRFLFISHFSISLPTASSEDIYAANLIRTAKQFIMFVFRRHDLPPDADFPADLEKLG